MKAQSQRPVEALPARSTVTHAPRTAVSEGEDFQRMRLRVNDVIGEVERIVVRE